MELPWSEKDAEKLGSGFSSGNGKRVKKTMGAREVGVQVRYAVADKLMTAQVGVRMERPKTRNGPAA